MTMRARDNPYAAHRVLKVRYRLTETQWQELLARLDELGYRAAIVGPQGSGKTTLLEDLAERLSARGFRIRLERVARSTLWRPGQQWRRLADGIGPRDCILLDSVDGVNRLSWTLFRFLTRRAGGLIVTAHREGFLPTLRINRTTSELLAQLIAELETDEGTVDQALAAELFERHKGNIRAAIQELFDRSASL
jgi:ABC-type cobalamin/Fe3+-siderophores transport system ATPase subunit